MRRITLRSLASILFLATAAAPAAAELKYVMRMEVTKVAEASTPMASAMGEALKKMIPDGVVEATYLIGQRGMRVESPKASLGLPAGAVALWTEKGEMVVLNPADKTFWRLDMNAITGAMSAAGVTMQATVSPASKGETMLGVPTEKRTFDVQMQLAMLANLPPEARDQVAGMMNEMKIQGEIWTAAGRYTQYGAILSKSAFAKAMETFGLGEFTKNLIMKQTMRMGGYELRMEVTSIGEESVPALMFEIPAGFKEVPPPGLAWGL